MGHQFQHSWQRILYWGEKNKQCTKKEDTVPTSLSKTAGMKHIVQLDYQQLTNYKAVHIWQTNIGF